MLKKYGILAGVMVLPAFLAGCPVDIYTTDYGTTYGSSGTVVVGNTIPDDYIKPTYTYGKGSKNPIIQSFTANPANNVPKGQPITFQVVAYDPNHEVLQFNWSATGGTLSTNSGQVVMWTPPDKPGVYTVMVTIANGNGGFVMGSQNLTVQPAGDTDLGGKPASTAPTPTPTPTATPTPSATPTPTPSATATPAASPTATPTTAPDKATISGTIKDDAGALKDAEVSLFTNDASATVIASFTTGDDGKYRFFNVPAGTNLVLSAKKTGYSEKLRTISALKGIDNVFDFDGTFALKRQ